MNLRTDYKPFNLRSSFVLAQAKPEKKTKWQESLGYIEELFITYLPYPDFREYPPEFMFLAGSVLCILIVVFFCTMFGYLFATNISTIFLSPADGGDDTSICEEIVSPNTGIYLSSRNGFWEGSDGFQYVDATMALSATNWKIKSADYSYLMNQLYKAMTLLGNFTSGQELGINLLFWFSLSATPDPANPANRFSLIGNPAIALNRQNIFGTVSSVAGECKLANQYASYDKANGMLILNIPVSDYLNNPICMAAGAPRFLGYNPLVSSNYLQTKVDVHSLVTAVSVNLNVLPLRFLIEIPTFRKEIIAQGHTYLLSQYFNPKFPGMSPIICLVNVTCTIRLGPSNYAIPFFHHAGNSTIKPEKCDCSKMSPQDKADPLDKCNLFTFLAGFIYFPADDAFSLFQFLTKQPAPMAHGKAFPPAFLASAFGQHSPAYPMLNQPASREKFYEFCHTSHGNCSMVTFSLFDTANPDWSLTQYYFQLSNGACQDQISIPRDAWQKLIDTPFTSLTQDYTRCRYNAIFVFFTQLGSALGTMDIIMPLSILSTVIFLYLYQLLTGKKIPEAYSKEERDSAINALAVSLLLTRDRQRAALVKSKGQKIEQPAPVEGEEGEMVTVDEKGEEEEDILSQLVNALHIDSEYHANAHSLDRIIGNLKAQSMRKSVHTSSKRETAVKVQEYRIAQVIPDPI